MWKQHIRALVIGLALVGVGTAKAQGLTPAADSLLCYMTTQSGSTLNLNHLCRGKAPASSPAATPTTPANAPEPVTTPGLNGMAPTVESAPPAPTPPPAPAAPNSGNQSFQQLCGTSEAAAANSQLCALKAQAERERLRFNNNSVNPFAPR